MGKFNCKNTLNLMPEFIIPVIIFCPAIKADRVIFKEAYR